MATAGEDSPPPPPPKAPCRLSGVHPTDVDEESAFIGVWENVNLGLFFYLVSYDVVKKQLTEAADVLYQMTIKEDHVLLISAPIITSLITRLSNPEMVEMYPRRGLLVHDDLHADIHAQEVYEVLQAVNGGLYTFTTCTACGKLLCASDPGNNLVVEMLALPHLYMSEAVKCSNCHATQFFMK